jgi:hypothetical protein
MNPIITPHHERDQQQWLRIHPRHRGVDRRAANGHDRSGKARMLLMPSTVVQFPKRDKKSEPEKHYKQAMTVQHLIDQLGFCDRKAKIYVRNSWMAGVVDLKEYSQGINNKPTVLFFLNEDEVPK